MTAPRGHGLALAGIVLVAAVVWGAVGQTLDVPTVFGDELIYWDAARSLAAGEGLDVRDGGYGFGPLYPALLAPVHALVPGAYEAYTLAKWVNAVVFSLAAVPAYLLARRLVTGPWALACAALTVVAPSALYTGFVMTEATAYAAACLAFLALQRVLERPSTGRQLAALGAIGLAASARLQLATLGIALLLALALRWVLARGPRLPRSADLRRMWPVLAATAVGVAAVALSTALGGDPPGGYDDLWGGYAVGEVVRWTWHGIAGLGLYLAFVPLAVAPAALALLARSDDPARQAFAALAPSVTVVLVLVVGVFSATEFGIGFLHDRYLFYVVPLALVLVASWATARERAPRWTLVAGAALVLVLAATLPSYLVGKDGGRQFDAVGTTAVAHAVDALARPDAARWLLVALAGLAVVALVLPPRARWAALLPIGALFVVNGVLAWDTRAESARNVTFATLRDEDVAWVDRAVGSAGVAALFAGAEVEVRDAFRLTEFFNASIGAVYDTGQGYAPTISSTEVVVGPGGGVTTVDGDVVAPSLVLVVPGGAVAGDRIAEGTLERLALWRARAPLTITRPG